MSALAVAAPIAQTPITALASLAVLSLESPRSRTEYSRYLRLYLVRGCSLEREHVQAWLNEMRDAGKGPVTRNIALAAVRCLAREAWTRGLISNEQMTALERIKASKVQGARLGNWLNEREAQALIDGAAQGRNGVRDAAIVALMLGCGLRRAEVAGLSWAQWQTREGRRVIVDLTGKGGKLRSVPVPRWASARVDAWIDAQSAQDQSASMFRVTLPSNVFQIVVAAAKRSGMPSIRPHDTRRTWAKLSRAGGADIEQISKVLGHSSIRTTQIYLGTELELGAGKAACDAIRMGD